MRGGVIAPRGIRCDAGRAASCSGVLEAENRALNIVPMGAPAIQYAQRETEDDEQRGWIDEGRQVGANANHQPGDQDNSW